MDIEYYIFFLEWKKVYFVVKLIGLEGFFEKCFKVKNDFKIGYELFDVVIGKNIFRLYLVDVEFDKDFEVEYIVFYFNKEVVFLYKLDKVFIEVDLLFNLFVME